MSYKTELKYAAVIVLTFTATAAVTVMPLAHILRDTPVEVPNRITAQVVSVPKVYHTPDTEDTDAELETLAVVPEPELPEGVPAYAAELIGRTIWGEAGGVEDPAERAAVAWCILNRVDAWGQSIFDVVTAPMQFQGYRQYGECPQEHIDLAADVLARWADEKAGVENVGRVLPAEYLYFLGDGEHNHFSVEFLEPLFWDWSLDSPYNVNK